MAISTTHYPSNYRAIVPVEDQYHSDVREIGHEAGSGTVLVTNSENLYSTRQWSSTEALIEWTYFLLGCAILLPYNALTNGTSFFLSRLADSSFYPTFSSYLSSVYTLTKLICLFYCTFTSKQSSPSRRIFVSIIATIFLIISLSISTFFRGTPSAFFSFVLFNAASLAALSSYLCTAVLARAALLGPSFLQSVFSGQGGIAVAISAVQVSSAMISLGFSGRLKPIISVVITVDDGGYDVAEEISARIFFGVSALFLGATLAFYTWLTRQTSYKTAIGAVKPRRYTEDADEITITGLVANDHRGTGANSRIYYVLKQNRIVMFSIAYVFAVTLAVFPAITARVRSVNPAVPPLLFTSVHFLVFSIGDLVGRQTCSFPRSIVWSDEKILAMSLMRTVFIPLVLLCNVYQPGTPSPISPVMHSDTLFMIILLTMGYTNGFVSCLALLLVSSLERNPKLEGRREDVDVAATLGGTFMMVGLAAGALFSFYVEAIV